MILCLTFGLSQPTAASTQLEKKVCGIQEYVSFYFWSRLAGNEKFDEAAGALNGITKVIVQTRDGRKLVGLKLSAPNVSRGAVLVVQGNAWSAVKLAPRLEFLRRGGYDVFVYDFRGYGMSEGHPRLAAMFDDYGAILRAVRQSGPYRFVFVYGFSLGGVITLNAFTDADPWSALVVDGTPSSIADMGCPSTLNPVLHLPKRGRVLVISGDNDEIVKRKQMLELLTLAQERQFDVWREEEWKHPFQEDPDSPERSREKKLLQFFGSIAGPLQ